jgi:hypothetical protein
MIAIFFAHLDILVCVWWISISPEKGQNVFMMFKFNVLMMGLQGAWLSTNLDLFSAECGFYDEAPSHFWLAVLILLPCCQDQKGSKVKVDIKTAKRK